VKTCLRLTVLNNGLEGQNAQIPANRSGRHEENWDGDFHDFGRATPSLRQPTPGAILILIVAGLSS
jgi:hypothetical protein